MPPHSHAHAGHSHIRDHARAPVPERMVSAMLLSAPARLAVALVLVAGLWALVGWAMT